MPTSAGRLRLHFIIGIFTAFLPLSPAFADDLLFNFAARTGDTNVDTGEAIAVDAFGNVYTTGGFGGSVDFDPGPGTFILSSAFPGSTYVQKLDANGAFVWARAFGNQRGEGIAIDALGNVYTTGSFTDTADFDPGPGVMNLTTSSTGAFISKLNSSGNLVWARAITGTALVDGKGIAVDTPGFVYLTGTFNGTADFDPGAGTAQLTSAGIGDIFVTKLTSSGNYVWADKMGGSGDDQGYSVAVDTDGNVYTTGYFAFLGPNADFDPGPGLFTIASHGGADPFVSKLDSNGSFVWAGAFGGPVDEIGHSIAVDAAGNVLTAGEFFGTADFEPGPEVTNLMSAGSADAYVSKLDADGNYVFAKRLGGTNTDRAHGVAVDASGNIYTTGHYGGGGDFDPGPGSAILLSFANNEVFVSKLDAAGNYVYAKSAFGDTSNIGAGIAVNPFSGVHVVGRFIGATDFDPSSGTFQLTSVGPSTNYDIFVWKLVSDSAPIVPGLPVSRGSGEVVLVLLLVCAGVVGCRMYLRTTPVAGGRL